MPVVGLGNSSESPSRRTIAWERKVWKGPVGLLLSGRT